MQDADDDLLPDVAALGQADRTILDARFERDRRRVHIPAEGRPSSFDARDVRRCAAIDPLRSGVEQRLLQLIAHGCIDQNLEAADAKVVAADDDRRPAAKRPLDVADNGTDAAPDAAPAPVSSTDSTSLRGGGSIQSPLARLQPLTS